MPAEQRGCSLVAHPQSGAGRRNTEQTTSTNHQSNVEPFILFLVLDRECCRRDLLAADNLLGGGELEHAELVLLHLEWSASGAVGAEELDRAVQVRLGQVIVAGGGVGALDELGTLNVHDGVVISVDGTALNTVFDVQPPDMQQKFGIVLLSENARIDMKSSANES